MCREFQAMKETQYLNCRRESYKRCGRTGENLPQRSGKVAGSWMQLERKGRDLSEPPLNYSWDKTLPKKILLQPAYKLTPN